MIGEVPAPHSRLVAKFPTAALLVLSLDISRWGELIAGRAAVRHYVTPRDLEP